MAPKVKNIWANLAVKDTSRTREFYKALGFKQSEGYDGGEVLASIQFGESNFIINFFKEEFLKDSIETEITDTNSSNEIMFSLSAANRDEVDEWAKAVTEAGGTVFSEPKEFTPKGSPQAFYGCGFADPDGHRFNVIDMSDM